MLDWFPLQDLLMAAGAGAILGALLALYIWFFCKVEDDSPDFSEEKEEDERT